MNQHFSVAVTKDNLIRINLFEGERLMAYVECRPPEAYALASQLSQALAILKEATNHASET